MRAAQLCGHKHEQIQVQSDRTQSYPVCPGSHEHTWAWSIFSRLLGSQDSGITCFFLSALIYFYCISNLLLVGNYFRSAFTTWHWVSCDRSLNASPGTVSFPSAHGLLGASSDSRWRKSTPKRRLTVLMLLESNRSNRFSFHTSSNPSKRQ